jgi:thiamine kinase-like enzyme
MLRSRDISEDATVVSGHGDLNPGNIGIMEDRVVLIDFETAAMVAPAFDVSRLCYSTYSNFASEQVIQMYCGDTNPKAKNFVHEALMLQAFIATVFGKRKDGVWSFNDEALKRFYAFYKG